MRQPARRIRKLTLINFQSHGNTTVTFDPGLNAIIGATDSGKSALANRGLKWVFYNEPAGTDYIKFGDSKAIGIVEFDDNTVITRTRGVTSGNSYDIAWPDGHKSHFEGFGLKPPDEVLQAHGMYPVNIGGTDVSLNFADQLDGPFLLQDTPAARANIIGAIAHTEVIDTAIKGTNSDTRITGMDISKLDKDIMEKEQKLPEYDDLESEGLRLAEVELLIDKLDSEMKIFSMIYGLNQSISEKKRELENHEKVLARYQVLGELIPLIESLSAQVTQYRAVLSVQNKREADESRLRVAKLTIEKYQNCVELATKIDDLRQNLTTYNTIRDKTLQITAAGKKVAECQAIAESYQRAPEAYIMAEKLQSDILLKKQVDKAILQLNSEKAREEKGAAVIISLHADLEAAVQGYQEAVAALGRCPMCFSEIDEAGAERIQQYLL